MYLTFEQFLSQRLSQEQPQGTSDLSGNGNVKIAGSGPRTVSAGPKQNSEKLNVFSPEKMYGKSEKKRQKK
jgi:hypothetical protein